MRTLKMTVFYGYFRKHYNVLDESNGNITAPHLNYSEEGNKKTVKIRYNLTHLLP
jgi:hypothetical protein